ncbi:MAG TPA: DUF1707 and FHA domain-containing protein [Streptosporangiaceae bacterium]
MAGTADGTPPPRLPVRASDAEREEAIAELRERFAAGHLSQDTFVCRMEVALAAREQRELAVLLADLPSPGRPRRGVLGWTGRAAAGLTRLGPRLSTAVTPVREAVLASARRAGPAQRPPRMPGLVFPAGSRGSFTIGRDPGCDLVIADITVSRQHAGLDRVMRGWLLTDLGSTNGTKLNGWRVREPVPVQPGDRVSFGSVTYVLRARPGQA